MGQPHGDAARLVDFSGDGLEPHRHIDVPGRDRLIDREGKAIIRRHDHNPTTPLSARIEPMSPSPVTIQPLLLKPQWMNGLSERLLVSHYENNYGGALRRLNAIRARLAALDWERAPVFEINGLKREELMASGSVILHEVYFGSLGGYGDNPPTGLTEPPDELAHALERDFGSVAAWRAEFTAMAKAQGGGSGWTILTWSDRLGCLVNQWAADHAHGLPGGTPILALDMYEHAYHLDFGAKAAAYVDQVMANLHWERIGARYCAAVGEGKAEDELFLPYGFAGAGRGTDLGRGVEGRAGSFGGTPTGAARSLSTQGSAATHRYARRCHRCTLRPRWHNGSRNCRGTDQDQNEGRQKDRDRRDRRFTAFAAFRSAARP
jgi:superoxide dismutase